MRPGFWLPLIAFSAAAALPVKVWVELRDKGPISAAGRAYEDAPVYPPYVRDLASAGLRPGVSLKWQNRVSGWVDSDRIGALSKISFVKNVSIFPRKAAELALPKGASKGGSGPGAPVFPSPRAAAGESFGAYDPLFDSIGVSALRDTLAQRGLQPGAGLRIAVIDEDFALGNAVFDSLFSAHRIVDQWDFVHNAPSPVRRDTLVEESHGAWVLSMLAADLPGVQGIAPKAQYLLYHTENHDSELYVEEDYLAAAVERAVDSGAQVINISLSYRYDFTDGSPNHPYSDFDGRTRPSSLAVLGAARRGVLVSVAVGNEFASRYGEPTVTAPADADSILSVGVVDEGRNYCVFSSTGPTYDGRLKPELSSMGFEGHYSCYDPVANTAGPGMAKASGTSFAAPAVAGIGALLRQLHPDTAAVSSQRIRLALMATARKAAHPEDFNGNGLVQAAAAHEVLLGDVPDAALAAPAARIRGVIGWGSGKAVALPWAKGLDLSRARLWDVQGRARRVRGGVQEGKIVIRADKTQATGLYLLQVPLQD